MMPFRGLDRLIPRDTDPLIIPRRGVIVDLNPIQVQLERESAPLLAVPDTFIFPTTLKVGMKVQVQFQRETTAPRGSYSIVITGILGGGEPVQWQPLLPYYAADVTDYGGGYGPGEYRISVEHKLQLRGLLRFTAARVNSAMADPLFTLPPNARPNYNRILTAVMYLASGTTGPASAGTAHTHQVWGAGGNAMMGFRLNIYPTGVVAPALFGTFEFSSGTWVSLDGVETWLD